MKWYQKYSELSLSFDGQNKTNNFDFIYDNDKTK